MNSDVNARWRRYFEEALTGDNADVAAAVGDASQRAECFRDVLDTLTEHQYELSDLRHLGDDDLMEFLVDIAMMYID